jgi:hypothetical protein
MAGATAAIPLALSGLSAYLILGIVLLIITAIGAVCWTITDDGRSGRLAMLIDAMRGNNRRRRLRSPESSQPAQHGAGKHPEP